VEAEGRTIYERGRGFHSKVNRCDWLYMERRRKLIVLSLVGTQKSLDKFVNFHVYKQLSKLSSGIV